SVVAPGTLPGLRVGARRPAPRPDRWPVPGRGRPPARLRPALRSAPREAVAAPPSTPAPRPTPGPPPPPLHRGGSRSESFEPRGAKGSGHRCPPREAARARWWVTWAEAWWWARARAPPPRRKAEHQPPGRPGLRRLGAREPRVRTGVVGGRHRRRVRPPP